MSTRMVPNIHGGNRKSADIPKWEWNTTNGHVSMELGYARHELFSKSYGAQGSNDATW